LEKGEIQREIRIEMRLGLGSRVYVESEASGLEIPRRGIGNERRRDERHPQALRLQHLFAASLSLPVHRRKREFVH